MHKYPERPISKGGLIAFSKSPVHYLDYCANPMVATSDMNDGSLFEHFLYTALGHTHKFEYIVEQLPVPEKAKTFTPNQEYLKSIRSQKTSEGKPMPVFSQDRVDAISEAVEFYTKKQDIKIHLSGLVLGEKLVKQDEKTGISIVGIPDLRSPGFEAVVEIKKTKDAYHKAFEKDFFNLGYNIQLAMYKKLTGAKSVSLCAFEIVPKIIGTEKIFSYQIFQPHTELMQYSERWIDIQLQRFSDWQFKGAPVENLNDLNAVHVRTIELPNWMKYE